ncbi:MAG: sialidase family protein [Bacteroidales bacterium]
MMKSLLKFIFFLSAVIILMTGCKDSEKDWNLRTTPFKPLLSGADHTSEGFLVPLDDGKILLLFRVDPGIEGDHVGMDGYIAQISYNPETDQWGEVKTIYNSHQYDDRNVHGGITKEGRIVVFFRKYDGEETVARYFMYSDDNGQTWSEPQKSKAWSDPDSTDFRGVWSTGRMFYIPETDKYAMPGCRRYITFSQDGTSWEEYNLITDNRDYKLSEIAGTYCGDSRIIALIRDDQRESEHPLVQVESHDNGQTWTDPVQTNIPPNQHWGCAPQLIYDQQRNLLIALTSDRYSRPNEQNSLFIYTASPQDVTGKPKNWTLRQELLRPWAREDFDENRPLNKNLYGYPTIAPINEKEYLVVFTERAQMHGTEQADLYYFRLIFE